ncbi:hypothetical protein KAR04_09565 [Candidatus Calescamantes bacterium]|nr:hypothetical protein [Candidatus Calescamantes bacterium]
MPQEHPADLPREQWLRQQLLMCEEETEDAVEAKSWQAVGGLRRLSLQYRNELDNLLKEQDDEEEPTSLAEVVALILSMPDAAFRHPDVVARVKQCS